MNRRSFFAGLAGLAGGGFLARSASGIEPLPGAHGGPVAVGKGYTIGENVPECFRPMRSADGKLIFRNGSIEIYD